MISQTYLYYKCETILFHKTMDLLSKRIDFYDRRGKSECGVYLEKMPPCPFLINEIIFLEAPAFL